LTTTEIVNSKNETLHTLAQNQYNLGPGGSPFGNSPLPPQLIAALQRRQQLLSQQSKCEFEFITIECLECGFQSK
jgi:hypothetical protein